MDASIVKLFSEVPRRPDYNPVRRAIETAAQNPEVTAALKLFASMPPSTGVLANPVRHHMRVAAHSTSLDLDVRSFSLRGILFEEDIVTGKADVFTVIFVGLLGRLPADDEIQTLRQFLQQALRRGYERSIARTAEFMNSYPSAAPDIAVQHWAALRKAIYGASPINASRVPGELLAEMIEVHLENVAVAAAASFIRKRGLTPESPDGVNGDPFRWLFTTLLGRPAGDDEARILGRLGTIQIHHGSAGSNMVARYFAALHTRSISDLFTATQMTLDCGRHFGAISDMTDFVHVLEQTPESHRDNVIRERIVKGNLPTFGHPEIAAAGRENRLEMDPRPALYLAPLFDAIDRGSIQINPQVEKRVAMLERIYQIALSEGIDKPGAAGRLRLTPNTDFGAWLVQEILGIEEPDRTLLSYAYRGFGWMMDVREQLQQPIIRPVIPPDPAIIPSETMESVIPSVINSVHDRLTAGNAFRSNLGSDV